MTRATAAAVLRIALRMPEEEAERFQALAPETGPQITEDLIRRRFFGLTRSGNSGLQVPNPEGEHILRTLTGSPSPFTCFLLRHSFLTDMIRWGEERTLDYETAGIPPGDFPIWVLKSAGAVETFWLNSWGCRTLRDLAEAFQRGLFWNPARISRAHMLETAGELHSRWPELYSGGTPRLTEFDPVPEWPRNFLNDVGADFPVESLSLDILLSRLPVRPAMTVRLMYQMGWAGTRISERMAQSQSSVSKHHQNAVLACGEPDAVRILRRGVNGILQDDDDLAGPLEEIREQPAWKLDLYLLGPGTRWDGLRAEGATVRTAIALQRKLTAEQAARRLPLQNMLIRDGIVRRIWESGGDLPDPRMGAQDDLLARLGAFLYDLWPFYGRAGVSRRQAREFSLRVWKGRPLPMDMPQRILYSAVRFLDEESLAALLKAWPELTYSGGDDAEGGESVTDALPDDPAARRAIFRLRDAPPLQGWANWAEIWPANLLLQACSKDELLDWLDRRTPDDVNRLVNHILDSLLPEPLGDAARMRWEQQMSARETAAELGISRASVNSSYRRIADIMRNSCSLRLTLLGADEGDAELLDLPVSTLGLPGGLTNSLIRTGTETVRNAADLFRTDSPNLPGIRIADFAVLYEALDRLGVFTLYETHGIRTVRPAPIETADAGSTPWPYNFITYLYRRRPDVLERKVTRLPKDLLIRSVDYVVEELPLLEQNIVRLRFREHLTVRATAERLDMPPATVHTICFRIRTRWMEDQGLYACLEMGADAYLEMKRETQQELRDRDVATLGLPDYLERRLRRMGARNLEDVVRILNGDWAGNAKLSNPFAWSCYEGLERGGYLDRGVYVRKPQNRSPERQGVSSA